MNESVCTNCVIIYECGLWMGHPICLWEWGGGQLMNLCTLKFRSVFWGRRRDGGNSTVFLRLGMGLGSGWLVLALASHTRLCFDCNRKGWLWVPLATTKWLEWTWTCITGANCLTNRLQERAAWHFKNNTAQQLHWRTYSFFCSYLQPKRISPDNYAGPQAYFFPHKPIGLVIWKFY